MRGVEIIDDPSAADVAFEPRRSRILSESDQAASAAILALRLGLPRQKANPLPDTVTATKELS